MTLSDEASVSSSSSQGIVADVTNQRMNLRELKKELKGIDKLTKKNLDIKSWKSDLNLWIKYQHIKDPETIFTACILTSSGEIREIIQDLYYDNSFTIKEEDDDEEENEEQEYPSLDDVVNAIEIFYGLKEDQNVLLRDLRSLKIKKNERVKDFNIRYRSLYLKLDKKRKKQINVFDYADALQNNVEAWKKVSLKDDISLNEAFKIAEKVDRLTARSTYNYYGTSDSNASTRISKSYPNNNNTQFKRKIEYSESQKVKDSEMEDLTRKMKNLSVK
eukprot:jgi/Orpsp1_1/1181180/evm.model.c7180000076197.1